MTRFGTQIVFDAAAWFLAILLGNFFRFGFDLGRISWTALIVTGSAVVVVQIAVGVALYLYRGRHPYGSFAEVRTLVIVILITTLVVGAATILFGNRFGLPRSTVIIAAPLALVLMASLRYIKRLLVERAHRFDVDARATLVYGAGYLGSTIVRRMQTERHSKYRPVGLIDDNPKRRNVWFDGVPVLGTGSELLQVARATEATILVIAIARVDSDMLRTISDAAAKAGLVVQVLPSLEEVLGGKTHLRDLRDLSIEDLIGRHPVDTNLDSIAGYLTGKRVLVTGAGGSIGSELYRQILRFSPGELMMLDHDETGLQTTQLSASGHGLLDTAEVLLADIRDPEALGAIFSERRPEVVFHAAALKHLPMLEQFPEEAWKSNVLGTRNVLEAALAVGVETFVNISTDKAAFPTSVLGDSKRLGEMLTAGVALRSGRRYLSVRFGNVLGSRGSMLPMFSALIESGGPLYVTDRDATRFFMTIPEACQLVVQAGAIGEPGEVLILDMGEPVRILDVAKRMIAMSGRPIEIVFSGLRRGEKLHEDLVGDNETGERRIHPKISHTTIEPVALEELSKAEWDARRAPPPL
ncbi:MAG: nucleoside-diphosphate sugar epimerase/dehydratase [Pseudolysinimonas sp.]